MSQQTEIVTVLRVLRYTGTREWVESTLKNSVQGQQFWGGGNSITAVSLNQFPELVQILKTPEPDHE